MILNTGSRTDIPAFFHKLFLNRVDEGFVCSKNPYNNDIYRYPINPKIIDCMCFYSKNPKSLVKNITNLDEYNQFWVMTINAYGKDMEVIHPDA